LSRNLISARRQQSTSKEKKLLNSTSNLLGLIKISNKQRKVVSAMNKRSPKKKIQSLLLYNNPSLLTRVYLDFSRAKKTQ